MKTPCPHCGTQVASSPGEEATCPSCGNSVRIDEATRIIEPGSIKLPDELAQGTALGRYEIDKVLGRGGMGTVYKANDPVLRRPVAIKVLNPDLRDQENFIRRFDREAAHLAQLKHDGVVQVMDRGVEDGRPFLVMELVEGPVLREVMGGKAMPLERALDISRQLAEVLDYSHRRGVIHRDIKPENILIDQRSDRPMLTDFGLSKAVHSQPFESRLTMTNVMMGTLDYMAPEQRRGKAVDHRADLYALGVVMYEMITGELPVGVFKPASRLVSAPTWVDDVINKLLDRDPNGRFPTAGKLVAALDGKKVDSGPQTVIKEIETPVPQDSGVQVSVNAEIDGNDEWDTFDWYSIVIVASAMCMVFAGLPFGWMIAAILICAGLKSTNKQRRKWKAGRARKPATFLWLNSGMWIALIATSLVFKPWRARWRVLDSAFGHNFEEHVIPPEFMASVGLDRVTWLNGNSEILLILGGIVACALFALGVSWMFKAFSGPSSKKRQPKSRVVVVPHDPRHLVRDPSQAWLGGVLAGIANKTGWDVMMVRIVTFVAGVVTSGAIFVMYLVAWFIIPKPDHEHRSNIKTGAVAASGCGCTTLVVLGVLAIGGVLVLLFGFVAVHDTGPRSIELHRIDTIPTNSSSTFPAPDPVVRDVTIKIPVEDNE